MDILTEAFKGLFPDREPTHEMKLKYSGKFSGYNGNVRYTKTTMEFHLSREWKEIDRDIKIGLIQSLMQKTFKRQKETIPKTTTNIEMYNIFIKKLHVGVPHDEQDPVLLSAFERINENFFEGRIGPTNLRWGAVESRTKFGSYAYAQDMITMNPVLKDKHEILDYVLYHEMLHKKMKFENTNGRNYHHTADFRKAEKSYPHAERLENELKQISRRQKTRGRRMRFFNWF